MRFLRLQLLLPWIAAAAALALLGLWWSSSREPREFRATISVPRALSEGDLAGFDRALEPRPFEFPRDHGAHPSFRTEWWYFTGNLVAETGRRFGYQLTFFRTALAPRAPERASRWASNQVWMAHFALTDVESGRSFAFERFSREALGLAGATAEPLHVWLEDWSARAEGRETLPLRLRAARDDIELDLSLSGGKPIALHGERGLSRKGAAPGNASYYYSFTRLATRGTLRIGDAAFGVEGSSWMDREWSTSALEPDLVGWDWFGLQLSDESELVFYRLRQRDGSAGPQSAGSLILASGEVEPLMSADVTIEELETWTSPATGVRYPSRWRFTVPGKQVQLELSPVLADQELRLSTCYWEGAVTVQGRRNGREIAGRGYVELVGYGEQ